jgi:hypothetical protein
VARHRETRCEPEADGGERNRDDCERGETKKERFHYDRDEVVTMVSR